ncbi:uncharacterized protein LOC108911254 [Anoplophora glabripennis]|uniref:uncharacterized protein LOC108911254 n=1 Tax=Anoplophora glabripennis TaxID=217634 RepID=UPI0008752FB2|nr:uncharacterized protein LOC108911254 [Anoplophora glabripennis]
MTKVFYLLVLATAGLELAASQTISCYDCDPQNFASGCGDPVGNAVRSSPCTVDADVVNGTSICVSAFLNVTGGTTNATGIYRGCRTLGPAVADFCDWFRQETQNANTTVLTCVSCNTTRCNTIGFTDAGGSGAHNIFASSVFILIFNAVLVTLLSGRE